MKRTQELFEQYEDAYFAILMDQVAKEEGKKALDLNRQLKEDSNAEVPEIVRRSCEKTIRKAFVAQMRKKTGRTLWRVLHTASVLVLIIAATMTISFAAFPEVRIAVAKMFLETYETHTDFSFEEETDGIPELEITLGWLPQGFVVSEEDSILDCTWKYLEDAEGATIYIQKSKPYTISVDTENAQMEEIEIQGYAATLITKQQYARVIWLNEDENVVYYVDSEDVSVDVILQVAKNVS